MMNLNRGTELELNPYGTDLERVHARGTGTKMAHYEMCKRIIDIFGALLGLVLFSWLMLIVAIWIKIEDPRGPVLFRQTRIGKYGQPFTIYKFRSMVQDAEANADELKHMNEIDGHMFKIRNDPRVTRIGRILRRTSIDELPQFFNVLKGEMSLVGPGRPCLRRWKVQQPPSPPAHCHAGLHRIVAGQRQKPAQFRTNGGSGSGIYPQAGPHPGPAHYSENRPRPVRLKGRLLIAGEGVHADQSKFHIFVGQRRARADHLCRHCRLYPAADGGRVRLLRR